MLKVQEYLRRFDNVDVALASLKADYGIESKKHQDGRVILDYDMIDSPKFNPIVRECRGLVLDYQDNWAFVARAFRRFFNYGEGDETQNYFNFSGRFLASDKEDGSLILLYFYKGKWCVNTRFSFAESKVNDSDYTWEELFWIAAKDMRKEMLRVGRTYVFELCSVYNKVVRHYAQPTVYLLSTFDGDQENLFQFNHPESLWLNVRTPKEYMFNNIDEVTDHIKKIEANDPTFEGIVIRDDYNNRLKVKSASYLVLHKKLGNRKPSVEDLYEIGLSDDGGDELMVYLPELQDKLSAIKIRQKRYELIIQGKFDEIKHITNQKEFALKIKDDKFAFAFFALKKGLTIRQVMVEYSKRFVDILERDLNDNIAPTF